MGDAYRGLMRGREGALMTSHPVVIKLSTTRLEETGTEYAGLHWAILVRRGEAGRRGAFRTKSPWRTKQPCNNDLRNKRPRSSYNCKQRRSKQRTVHDIRNSGHEATDYRARRISPTQQPQRMQSHEPADVLRQGRNEVKARTIKYNDRNVLFFLAIPTNSWSIPHIFSAPDG